MKSKIQEDAFKIMASYIRLYDHELLDAYERALVREIIKLYDARNFRMILKIDEHFDEHIVMFKLYGGWGFMYEKEFE